jgi:hypothetical protein
LNRTTTHGRRARRAIGFTLIELLTIIIILGMLISLSTPSILIVRRMAKVKLSHATYKTLGGGIELYRGDDRFTRPPPSDPSDPNNYTHLEGRFALVQFMIGYMSAAKDGVEGAGYRWRENNTDFVRGGKVYGPYGGCDHIERGKGRAHPVFVEAFDNDILYFRFDDEEGYIIGHNSSADPEAPSNLEQYTRDQLDPNRPYYRGDYILISGGPDKLFKDVTDGKPDVDDITNFRFRLPKRLKD